MEMKNRVYFDEEANEKRDLRTEIFEEEENIFPSRYSELTDEEAVRLCHEGDSLAEEYLLNKY